jgi:hypothetical protein
MTTGTRKDKDRVYFNASRHDLFQLIPSGPPGRVLEIGAAEGSMLVALKRSGKAREVVGVELVAMPGGAQNHEEIDRFIIADVERRVSIWNRRVSMCWFAEMSWSTCAIPEAPLSISPGFCGAAGRLWSVCPISCIGGHSEASSSATSATPHPECWTELTCDSSAGRTCLIWSGPLAFGF